MELPGCEARLVFGYEIVFIEIVEGIANHFLNNLPQISRKEIGL